MSGVTGVRIGIWQDGSPEWHAARAQRIGGSDVGVVCEWSKWQTRAELLAIKLGERKPQASTPATERGHYLEGAVADWLDDRFSLTYDDDLSQGTYVHPSLPWASYNPDRITTNGQLVEIKTAAEKSPDCGWGRQGTDQIPLTYQAQCIWGMHVLGLKVCRVGVLFGAPFQFQHYLVKYDAEVADHLVTEGERFMADLIHPTQNGYAA